jgi:serine/threonine-protein kinase
VPRLTPEEALRRDEARRMRVFAPFVLLLVTAVGGAMWLLGGDPFARAVMGGGLVIALVGALWAYRGLSKGPERLERYHLGFGLVCAVVMVSAFYYFGFMSPGLIMVTFGAYIFTTSQSFRGATVISSVLVVAHLSLSILTITGAIRDRGLYGARNMSVSGQLVVLALVHFVFVATFVIARQLRRSAQKTLEDLDRAARGVAQRELLLAEARQDLYQALQIGGPGRYTEQTVGNYRLGVLLGRGGMGEIYEAQRVTDGERCAIKLLHAHLAADPSHFERFRREAELCRALTSPHVVRVLEVSSLGDAPQFIAMERLSGRDLATMLKDRPRLPPADVAEMVRQVAMGLESARRAGVVHRDLKPQNLFLADHDAGSGPVWKILDFGVSTLRSSGHTLTAGAVVGTPQYMPPEQARGRSVDHRADVYALAVIAYRALTGFPAFSGADVAAVLFAVASRMPSRPTGLVPSLPPQIDDVLLVGLAKDPPRRFASAMELANHLCAALEGRIDGGVRQRAWDLSAEWAWGSVRLDAGGRRTEPFEKLDADELDTKA